MSNAAQLAMADQQPQQQPPRDDYYLAVLSFVISNAWRGECMAVENYSEMVPMLESVDDKITTVMQAKEEAKHILVLEKLARTVGARVDESMCQDDWPEIRSTFHDAAKKGDLAACLIIQDLMIESFAIGIYSTFADPDNGDAETRRVADILLKDELEHLDIGIGRIAGLMERDSEAVHDSLVWAHSRVTPLMFRMVETACDFLCERKDVPCRSELAFVQDGVLHLAGERSGIDYIDLNRLKVATVEQYVAMLDRAGFNSRTVNQLIAGMAAYQTTDGRDTGIAGALAKPIEPPLIQA